ncbi:MAG TPA: hypothetical protein VFZ23_02920 [Pyrinomonadaceae bacterium]
MSYQMIDAVIEGWAKTHGLTVFKEYKDTEVRSVEYRTGSREGCQIWIDQPNISWLVGIHLWDFKRVDRGGHRRDFSVPQSELREYLESALHLAKTWLNQTNISTS